LAGMSDKYLINRL